LRPFPLSSVFKGEHQILKSKQNQKEEKMKIGEKKMEKEEMKNIHAGIEKNAEMGGSGAPNKNTESKCVFAAGSCCQSSHCPSNSKG
jgi:hypothetical protein